MNLGNFDPDIMKEFLIESGELLEQLEVDLVELESSPADQQLLNQIFRAMHTIKGSASFLGLTNLVQIAHAAETALNGVRNETVAVGRNEMDMMLAAVDVIKQQSTELTAGRTEVTKADPALVAQLVALGECHCGPAAANPEATAATGDAGEADVRWLALDPAKVHLIEHMVADFKQNIAQMRLQLDRLCEPGARWAAGSVLSEFASDLVKVIDFFEISECLKIAKLLEHAFSGIESICDEQLTQFQLRARALRPALSEQTAELESLRLATRQTGTLVERLTRASAGRLESDCFLETGSGESAVMGFDGVVGTAAGTCRGSGDNPDLEEESGTGTGGNWGFVAPRPGLMNKTALQQQSEAADRQQVAAEQTIRVEVGRIESLMNLVGELVLQNNRISTLADDVGKARIDPELLQQLEMATSTLDRVTSDIQVAVMRTRMQPLEKLFGKYPRLIRDLAIKTGKQIQLVVEGGETEVDKSVIEELGDALIHLLLNSVDHGVEKPADRRAACKPEIATIRVSAGYDGTHVRVQVIDDGRGLQREKIGRKAMERGLCTREVLETLRDDEVFRFVFEPGFSTAEQVSDLSGRGVGMDVVRTNIERKLKGSVTIDTERGNGTTLTIAIPLTMSIMRAMMVAAGGDIFAMPLTNITKIVRPTPEMLTTIGGAPALQLHRQVYPLLSASAVFECKDRDEPEPFVVLIGFNQKMIGLRVARVIGQQDIVIKTLDGLQRAGPISGVTVRNDGGVSPIIDVIKLLRFSQQWHADTAA